MIRSFAEMFIEFELELPVLTRLVIDFSHIQKEFWFLAIPVSVFTYAGIETMIFTTAEKTRLWINRIFWLKLLSTLAMTVLAIGTPLMQITWSLSG